MSSLERAIEIAAAAHGGQVDKGGEPYILHPLRVMFRMQTAEERITAVLHDVVEDSVWTLDRLREEGFSCAVVDALEALTKRLGEDRLSAAHRAAANRLARIVKLADNAENTDPTRLRRALTPQDLMRLEEYRAVRRILEQAAGEQETDRGNDFKAV